MKQGNAIKIEKIQQILQKRGIGVEKFEHGIRLSLEHAKTPNVAADFYITNPEIDIKKLFKSLSVGSHKHETAQTAMFGCTSDTHACYAMITLKKNTGVYHIHHKGAKAVIEELQGVDSKMFRQAMDQLGLPRSGKVRLALTRIFRDAMDADELMATIADEADRIVKAGEQDIIRDLRKVGQVTFITNILHILWETIVLKHIKSPDKFLT
ncbi:hypothetical protein BuS5_03825 [Desulfosarcina sp. BuS5]|uniref:hypothetical protein n=1 Tax=Desulfosarcina sp. BuS5 TaxID=933262 RepID=UPI0004884987|nr:hypothetical protein [Desulfosarcina sp. BuS5]WDN90854.1 hypothetical protein BuS5_03825 [Desulfosarcina sp. BuS5]